MNSRLNIRKTMFLMSVGLLAFSVCLYAYLYRETSMLIGNAIAARESLRSAEASKLQGKDIVSLFDSTLGKRAGLKDLFVPSEDAVAVIQAIESVGESSGASVSISSINAVQPTEKAPIGHVSSAVVISGTWKDVLLALSLFEDLPYDSAISNLSLRYAGDAVENSGGAHRWQADFSLSVSTISKKQ